MRKNNDSSKEKGRSERERPIRTITHVGARVASQQEPYPPHERKYHSEWEEKCQEQRVSAQF